MTAAEHLALPICQTRQGLRTHLMAIGVNATMKLCWELNIAGNITELENKLWEMKNRKILSDSQG